MANEKNETKHDKPDDRKNTGIPVKLLILKQDLNHQIEGKGGTCSVHDTDGKGGVRYTITYLPAMRHHKVEVHKARGSKEQGDEVLDLWGEHMIHETHVADWVPLRE